MAISQSNSLIGLERKVQHLIFLYSELRKENETLREKAEKQAQQVEVMTKQLQEWEKRYQSLKMAKVLTLTEEEAVKNQKRLSKLEREIEKCIALLNE